MLLSTVLCTTNFDCDAAIYTDSGDVNLDPMVMVVTGFGMDMKIPDYSFHQREGMDSNPGGTRKKP